jgi:hypothetical protein
MFEILSISEEISNTSEDETGSVENRNILIWHIYAHIITA